MIRPRALIDNDALVNLTHLRELGIFDLIRNLFSQVLIPEEVKNEYALQKENEPHRDIILQRLLPNRGFWALCTHYDQLSAVFLYDFNGIDKGEAELVSQAEKIGVRLIISDDVKFKNTLESINENLLVVSSLYIIAALDINGFILDQPSLIKAMHEIRPFKSRQLRESYEVALHEYSLKWTKKKISEKTSLKKLLS